MILSYHLWQLPVSPINWHLSRHCGFFGLSVWFVFWVCVCLCFCVWFVFGALFCFGLFCVLALKCDREQDYVSVLHQLTFEATLQQTAYA